jgi:CRISPR-associated protein Cas2
MRILVMFDLPTLSKEQRRAAARFRKFLLDDGYDMLQFSIYSRICNGKDAVAKHLQRLNSNLPRKGKVRGLQVTEKQYAGMFVFIGTRTVHEEKIGDRTVIDL